MKIVPRLLTLFVAQPAIVTAIPTGDVPQPDLTPIEELRASQATLGLLPTKVRQQSSSCTYLSSQISPIDIPQQSPFVSQGGYAYYPRGSQDGKILAGTYRSLYANGPSQYPQSNSYKLAVTQCAGVCDSDLTCLSFNVITVVEDDFNNCVPTWECRFSSQVYNRSDYWVDNGTPSYVWTLSQYDPPDCSVDSSVFASPLLWNNRGLDPYLNDVARVNGILGDTKKFLERLMNYLGINSYTCLSDNADCDIPALTNSCANWVDRQISTFQRYMYNNERILDAIKSNVGSSGWKVFKSFWYDPTFANGKFDSRPLLEGIIDGALGCIPDLGSYLYLIATGLQDILDNIHSSPDPIAPTIPSSEQSWLDYVADFTPPITHAQSNPGGTWFIDDPAGEGGVLPDPSSFFENMQPFYNAKVAMASMSAQSVFFLTYSLPVPFVSCTQKMADSYASMIDHDKVYTNTAFCAGSSKIAIPILGYLSPRLYSKFVNVTNILNVQYVNVWQPSSDCYANFGARNTSIALYNSPLQLPVATNTSEVHFDMTEACSWSIPICDMNLWYPLMMAQNPIADYNQSEIADHIHNTANWCAYNMGFVKVVTYCGWVANDPEQPDDPRFWYHDCYQWKPKKVFNLLSPSNAFRKQGQQDTMNTKVEEPQKTDHWNMQKDESQIVLGEL